MNKKEGDWDIIPDGDNAQVGAHLLVDAVRVRAQTACPVSHGMVINKIIRNNLMLQLTVGEQVVKRYSDVCILAFFRREPPICHFLQNFLQQRPYLRSVGDPPKKCNAAAAGLYCLL